MECWKSDPSYRPSFGCLSSQLQTMMTEEEQVSNTKINQSASKNNCSNWSYMQTRVTCSIFPLRNTSTWLNSSMKMYSRQTVKRRLCISGKELLIPCKTWNHFAINIIYISNMIEPFLDESNTIWTKKKNKKEEGLCNTATWRKLLLKFKT